MSRDPLAIARLEAEQRQARYAAETQRLAERLRVTPQKAEVMMELGLGDEQPWVYFARALRPRGVRIIPQPIALRGWGQVSA